ncbi:hypothetical protein [Aggregatibacter kilianii]|uniref:hypothetical protein n=1 Tax=Aggregatibacter kilianii TaxID=2025884 RepID=UPI000D64DEE6|nr:hypothetical protein [Aggregatibacter kilianii]
MKKVLFILGLLSPLLVNAETVTVGDSQIELTGPHGMVKVSPEMGEFFTLLQAANKEFQPMNWVIANYVFQENLENDEEDMGECSITIPYKLVNKPPVSSDYFNQVTTGLKLFLGNSNHKKTALLENVVEREKKAYTALSLETPNNIEKDLNQLEVLQENDRSSILLTTLVEKITNADNREEVSIEKTALATIYVKDKILTLNCRSPYSRNDWLKSTIINWTNEILTKNE